MKKQNIQNNKSCRRVHKGVKQISFMENRGENVRVRQKYDSDRSRIPFTPPPTSLFYANDFVFNK